MHNIKLSVGVIIAVVSLLFQVLEYYKKDQVVVVSSLLSNNVESNISQVKEKPLKYRRDTHPETYTKLSTRKQKSSFSYVARIGKRDHYTYSGKPLRSAIHIIAQDRANVHRFNLVDREDEIDTMFQSKQKRLWLVNQLNSNQAFTSEVKKQIEDGTPLIRVSFYDDDSINVTLEENVTRNSSRCQVGRVVNLNPDGDNFLSVRTQPDSKSNEMNRLGLNDSVYICNSQGKWRLISYQNNINGHTKPCSGGNCQKGWVFYKYISID